MLPKESCVWPMGWISAVKRSAWWTGRQQWMWHLSKDTDAVPYKIAIDKLSSYRLDGQTEERTENWFNDGAQGVMLSDVRSGWGPVTSKVPQGSQCCQQVKVSDPSLLFSTGEAMPGALSPVLLKGQSNAESATPRKLHAVFLAERTGEGQRFCLGCPPSTAASITTSSTWEDFG